MVLALVVICFLVTPALAADEKRPLLEESGNAFVHECSAVEKEDRDISAMDRAILISCFTYIQGFSDGAIFAFEYTTSNQYVKPPYCAEGVQAAQIVKVVLKYIREHPETADLRTSKLIGRALQDAFPCVRE
jgi:ribosomal protein S26